MSNNPLQTPQDPFRLPEPVETGAGQTQPKAGQPAAVPMPPVPQQPVSAPMPTAPTQYDESQINMTFIQRAQQLQAQYVHDPFVYSKELNALKAEYMMRRYGKEIKIQSKE